MSHARILAAAAALVLGAVVAVGGEIEVFVPNAHSLTGRLPPGGEHYIPLDLPAGTSLSFQYRADKKADKANALLPVAVLVGPDGADLDIPTALIKDKKGFDVKKLVIDVSGRHILVLRGRDAAGGPYALKVKAKFPKSYAGTFDGNGVDLEIPFPADTDAAIKATVKGAKGGAVPTTARLRQPDGNAFGASKFKQKKTSFSASGFSPNAGFGTYVLTFDVSRETALLDRTFSYKIVVKLPKVAKAKLEYTNDIVVAPLVTSIVPSVVDVRSDPIQMTVQGRFFQPGATVFLRKGGELDWIPEGQIVTGASITTPIRTLSRAPGFWDVISSNPSGGQTLRNGALLVRPPTPTVLTVDPTFTSDDRTSTAIELTGAQLSNSTEVTLRRDLPGGGEEVITPSNVVDAASGGINVTFSPFRRSLGTYDIVVTNPGPIGVPNSATTTASDVFEIRNAPPTLTAATPDRHLAGGTFTMTIDGAEIDDGASARLRRTGQSDVQGTFETVLDDGAQMTVRFDMDGQSVGFWDLLVENPDLQQASLTEVFGVTADDSMSLSQKVLGEPSISIAEEHDLGLIVWMETDETATTGSDWDIRGRRFDAKLNQWQGGTFTISTGSKGARSKRTVSASYNPAVDQWLVVWTELTFVQSINEKVRALLNPVSGDVYQVYGRRVDTDGGLVGAEIDFIDGSLSATGSGQVYDQFEYSFPEVHYAPWDDNWYLIMSQQWDNLSLRPDNSLTDDFDVFVWRLPKDNPRLDPGFHLAIHTTQNHEGEGAACVNDDADRFLIVASSDSRQLTVTSPREIEAKWVTAGAATLPGSGGSTASPSGVVQVTSRGGSEVKDFTIPRCAYNPDDKEYLVVYERIDEGGSNKKEIRARRLDSTQESTLGSEIVIAESATIDQILPRVVYNSVAGEYLVTWTHDAGGSARARGQRVTGGTDTLSGSAIDFGSAGSGLPCVAVDTARGSYTRVFVTSLSAVGADRAGTGFRLEIFE